MSTAQILVPLDGSPRALAALPVAHALASALHAAVRVLHVEAAAPPLGDALHPLALDPEQLRGAVLERRAGEPGRAISQAARERSHTLIAMCTHTDEVQPGQALGPIALRVLTEGAAPMVFVNPARNDPGWQLRHLLLPHDGTPTTSAADRPAAELANAARARLSVLHVAVAGARTPVEPGSLPLGQYADQPQHEWPEWAAEFIARLTYLFPIDRALLRIHLARGEPACEILRFAEAQSVDLIVLAWRGALEPAHATVIKRVLLRAPCPVMVVPARASCVDWSASEAYSGHAAG